MKTRFVTLTLLAAALLTACQPEDTLRTIEQNPFFGSAAPFRHISHELRTSTSWGANSNDDTTVTASTWIWQNGLLQSIVDDVTGNLVDSYYYDSRRRLDSITDRYTTYRFHYNPAGLLTSITFGYVGNREVTMEFYYAPGYVYPLHYTYRLPVENTVNNVLVNDTVELSWNLHWKDGNLVLAEADSGNFEYRSIASIEYFYDNNINPYQGVFDGSAIYNAELFYNKYYSRNNITRYVQHYTDGSSHEFKYTYKYDEQGCPTYCRTAMDNYYGFSNITTWDITY